MGSIHTLRNGFHLCEKKGNRNQGQRKLRCGKLHPDPHSVHILHFSTLHVLCFSFKMRFNPMTAIYLMQFLLELTES